MMIRTISAAMAVIFGLGLVADAAMAEQRKKKRQARSYDSYYAGPDIVRGVPGLRLLFGDHVMSRAEFEALYGDDPDEQFDEAYYEPRALPPPKPRTAPAVKKAAAPPEAAPPKPKTAATQPKASATQPQQKQAAAPAGGMTCEKAGSIVSGYGFESVKPEACKGKIYAFAATRDGKSFAIKLDSASGELTEVKKLQ